MGFTGLPMFSGNNNLGSWHNFIFETSINKRYAKRTGSPSTSFRADLAGRLISSLYLSNPTTQASDSRYFQYDGLGSVIGRTNQQGNAVSNYSYEALGAITSQKGQDSNSYTYMGQAYDSSTGLYYFNARWYDASIGRFISADPLPGNPFQSGSTNRYAYALDNPIAYEDVSGLSARGLDTHINNALNGLYLWLVISTLILSVVLFAMLAIGTGIVTGP